MTLTLGTALLALLLGPTEGLASGELDGGLPGQQQTDTTIIVPAGARLEVHPMGGEIVVRTWERNEVRVQADHSSRSRVRVRTEGSIVKVDTDSSRPGPEIVDYVITVPARMDLLLGGVSVDIDVQGTQGRVEATTVNGDIQVVGGGGRLQLQAVNGDVRVEGARGAVDARAVNGAVELTNIQGQVEAETVSGRVILQDIVSNEVSASSVSGRIFFDGPIADNGRYSFSTHSGSITLAVPPSVNATISVGQISGTLTSSFAGLVSQGDRNRRQTFTLGTGTAMIEAETFSGRIRIARRGEVTP